MNINGRRKCCLLFNARLRFVASLSLLYNFQPSRGPDVASCFSNIAVNTVNRNYGDISDWTSIICVTRHSNWSINPDITKINILHDWMQEPGSSIFTNFIRTKKICLKTFSIKNSGTWPLNCILSRKTRVWSDM